jgi:hypothetical protein
LNCVVSGNVASTCFGSNAGRPGRIAQYFARISHQNRNLFQLAAAATVYEQRRDHAGREVSVAERNNSVFHRKPLLGQQAADKLDGFGGASN